MAKGMVRVPVREQDPKERATNFEEVCLGYNQEEAMEEATRCLNCKNAKCIEGCPVSINIPAFIQEVKEGNIEEAYKIIGQSSALPAICGRVCPQESRSLSAKESVFAASKEIRYPSENWSVLSQTMLWSMISNRKEPKSRTVTK